MIAAVAGALDTTLAELTTQITEELRGRRAAERFEGADPVMLALAA